MTWNPDAPLEMLDRAARVYIELMSHAAYCNWLEQELPRVKIYLNFKSLVIYTASTKASGARDPQQPTPPLAATGAASPIVDEMVETLRWYGNRRNYDMAGEIIIDEGTRARDVLRKHGFQPPYEASA